MSKEKLPRETAKGEKSGNYVEIPLPELANDDFEKGRVFHYGLARWCYGFLLFITIGCVLIVVTEIPDDFCLLWGILLLPVAALLLLAKYEIRHDRDGFSICIGKKIIRRYAWDDVTAVNEQKQVFIHGKKQWLIETSMSGYEGFYARARAACKKKGQPVPPLKEKSKNRPDTDVEERNNEANKSFVEFSLPDLSGIKDKLDEGLERIEDAVDNHGQKYIARDIQTIFEKDRVGLDPSLARNGYGLLVCVAIMWVVCLAAKAPLLVYVLCGLLILPAVLFLSLGKYEIRYDPDGFSVRLGKKELRRYAWTDVTDVRDGKRVYVQGKRLFADSSMAGFDHFYHLARVSCKGKGKPTPPSEKKRRSRSKAPTSKK